MAIGQLNDVLQYVSSSVRGQDQAARTDGQLLACFLEQHDESAFAALVSRHGSMIWGVCRRLLNYQDAEDAFQATFLVFVRKARCIVPREMVANWLYGVARQTALKARATAAKRAERERQVQPMLDPPATEADHADDLQALLDQELSRLPDRYRVAIVLCELEGKTRKEAAHQLGCPEGTLAARLSRGRLMLARRLARRGVALSAAALAGMLSSSAAASVPLALLPATIEAAAIFAAGQGTVTSAPAVTLAEGVLRTMLMTKLKLMTGFLLSLGMIALAGSSILRGTVAAAPAEPQQELRGEAPQKPAPIPGAPAKENPPEPDLPALQKLKEAEEAYRKARELALKEIDEALRKAEAAAASAQKDLGAARDNESRKKASDAMRKAHSEAHQWRITRSRVQMPRFEFGVKPPVPEESRLGGRLDRPNETLRSQLKLAKGQGLVFHDVEKDRAAARAGIQANDVLVQLNGKAVPSDMIAFRKLLTEIKPDEAVTATVVRQGKEEPIKELKLPAAGASAVKPAAPKPPEEKKKPGGEKPDPSKSF